MIEIGPEEQVIRIVRKHWFALLAQGFFYLILLFSPFVLLTMALQLPVGNMLPSTTSTFLLGGFATFLWFYILWNAIFLTLTNYLLDVLIITDKRIFEIDQLGLFRRESSTFRIDRIQDVTVDVKGIIATFLDFGDINIHTAGEGKNFTEKMVKDPYGVKKQINEAIDRWNKEERNVTIAQTAPTSQDQEIKTPMIHE
jgi:uncharacterized membrane protein YdbT with pleckstrin-like domain